MLVVGLTGGMGSGKTSVSERFAALGAPIIDTDVIAREIVAPGLPACQAIQRAFGDRVLRHDGTLNRDALRDLAFDDQSKRRELEGIMHPAIKREVRRRLEEVDAPYCIVVVPLLIESNFTDVVDRVLVVDAPEETRLHRVRRRSDLSEAQIRQIFATQASSKERRLQADDVLDNDGDLANLDGKVATLHRHYLQLSGDS